MSVLGFFRDLLSLTDKASRERAEEQYKAVQRANPFELCSALVQLCEQSTQVADKQLALVLLRQTLKLDWNNVGQESEKLKIGARLLALLGSSVSEKEDTQIIKALVAIPASALMTFSEQVVQIVQSRSRKGLMLLDSFAEFAFSPALVQPCGGVLSQILDGGDTVPAHDQLLAVKAAVNLVLGADQAGHANQVREFACMIPSKSIRVIARAIILNADDDDSLIESTLESLVSLSEACGWALDATLAENCAMLLDMCENKNVSASARALSMTIFGSIMARKGSSASKDAAFSTRTIRCILQLQVEDEEQESNYDDDVCPDEDDILALSQSGPRGAALDSLSQLAHGSAGTNADASNLLNIILAQIKPLLASPDWRARAAALSTVAVVANPLSKILKNFITDIVAGNCKMLCDDPHARVRLAAAGCLNALLEASKKIGAEIRKSMHAVVLGTLNQAITQNESRDPVATRCAVLLTLTRFYGGTSRKEGNGNDDEDEVQIVVPKNAILPYLDGLVATLVGVLQRSNVSAIQERSMEALTAIGTQAKTDFGKYYPILVPGIKTALQLSKDAAVKTAAMILVATCAETVDKACFAKDATEVVGWFLQRIEQGVASSSTKEETSELEGLFHFCERVAAVLGKDFAPFMPHVLPLVCRAAVADLGISVSEDSSNADNAKERIEQDEESGRTMAVTKLRGVGNLEISANVYAFQLRESALSLLDVLAENGCLAPEHLEDCVNALRPNISDRACTAGLNTAAAEAAGSVFNASCESSDPSIPTRVFVALGTPIIAGLAFDSPTPYTTDEMDRRSAFASAVERMTRICHLSKGKVKPPAELLPHLIQVLMNALSASLTRRSNWQEDLKVQGFEADMIQSFGEEILDEEASLASDLVDALGYMLKTDPQGVWPHFQSLVLPFMVGFLNLEVHGDVNLTHNALCSFVDALEFGPEDPRVGQACLPNLKKALFSTEPKLRQVAAYGLGVCAQLLKDDSWVGEVTAALVRCLNVKDAKAENMILATENVISAIGKFYQRTSNPDLLRVFVENLPIVNDAQEAEYAHKLLFNLVLSNAFPGPDKSVVLTCAMILQNHAHNDEENELADEWTLAQVPVVLAHVKSRSGVDAYRNLVASLASDCVDDEIKAKMLTI